VRHRSSRGWAEETREWTVPRHILLLPDPTRIDEVTTSTGQTVATRPWHPRDYSRWPAMIAGVAGAAAIA